MPSGESAAFRLAGDDTELGTEDPALLPTSMKKLFASKLADTLCDKNEYSVCSFLPSSKVWLRRYVAHDLNVSHVPAMLLLLPNGTCKWATF